MRRFDSAALFLVPLLAACSSPNAARPELAPDGAVLCLGTGYPEANIIDPDAPDYEDASHTTEQVRGLFGDARAADSQAYRAYEAAHANPDVMRCAFCPCGCSAGGHMSAADCFKDLHGLSCATCQAIALRAGELKAAGLSDDDVKLRLQQQYPAP